MLAADARRNLDRLIAEEEQLEGAQPIARREGLIDAGDQFVGDMVSGLTPEEWDVMLNVFRSWVRPWVAHEQE